MSAWGTEVRVVNATRNLVLAERAELASGPWQRMVGLLGRDRLEEGEGLILQSCNAIHTCFMRFAIDVIFLDKQGRVVRLFPEMVPFRFSPLVFRAHSAVELPAGTIARSGTEVEDHLVLA